MAEKTKSPVIIEVKVAAVHYGRKPLVRGLPLQHVAQACEKLFGPDCQERLVFPDELVDTETKES